MTLAIRQRVWRKFLQVKKPEAREGMQSSGCTQEGILSPAGTTEEEKKSSVQEAPPLLHHSGAWKRLRYSLPLWKRGVLPTGKSLCRLACYSVSFAGPCPLGLEGKRCPQHTELPTALNLGSVVISVLGFAELCSLGLLPLSQDDDDDDFLFSNLLKTMDFILKKCTQK